MSTTTHWFDLQPSAERGRLLIVDGHAYAYRAYHAIRSLHSPAGLPTNAIYGFIKMLGKLRLQAQPTHLVVIWDGGLSADRMAMHSEYKSQRPPMPEGLAHQLDALSDYLKAAGIASWCRDGVEADDWIAVAARQAVAEGMRVLIASADKDFMQLVSSEIGLLNPNDKVERVWTDAEVLAKTGVLPAQIVDWLSLVGDAVDNIAGVPGIGPKTAAELLGEFGTIEGIYERLAEVRSERHRKSLLMAAETMVRNQKLIRLRDEVGGPFCLEETTSGTEDAKRLGELFSAWGFLSLARELAERQTTVQGKLL